MDAAGNRRNVVYEHARLPTWDLGLHTRRQLGLWSGVSLAPVAGTAPRSWSNVRCSFLVRQSRPVDLQCSGCLPAAAALCSPEGQRRRRLTCLLGGLPPPGVWGSSRVTPWSQPEGCHALQSSDLPAHKGRGWHCQSAFSLQTRPEICG